MRSLCLRKVTNYYSKLAILNIKFGEEDDFASFCIKNQFELKFSYRCDI